MNALLALVAVVVSLVTAAEPYEMADLEALAKKGDYAALVAHLEDIRPSKRDAAWDHLVETGVVGAIGLEAKEPDAMAAWAVVEDLAKRYPTVGKSKSFRDAARPLVLAGGQACYQLDTQDVFCNQMLLADAQRDSAASLEIGKLVAHHQFAYFAVPFFAPAVDLEPKKACATEELQRAVIAALGLPADDSKVAIAARIATGACATQLRPALVKGLADSGYFKDNACAALKAKNALDDYQRVQCSGK